ncbi:Vacuolar basic amino acid transporter 4 [Saccharomyces pastorianus]|uniref:Vacuolar basic amino acid transporter 4 n=1 Tax=Saccharomyces pastorianus TaxID=27292 RepID=A0A6C1E402_SACPS|nr:Vacuolar basic amino acid transporter 4 [Saccharomyces pastorianus]
MGKKDKQRKKLREFAKLKNKQQNLRKSVQSLKKEVQRRSVAPESLNRIVFENLKREEANENSPLLPTSSENSPILPTPSGNSPISPTPSEPREGNSPKTFNINVNDTHFLPRMPENSNSVQTESDDIDGKLAENAKQERLKFLSQEEPARGSPLQRSMSDFSNRSASPLQSITSDSIPMSVHDLPESLANALEGNGDMTVAQLDSSVPGIDALPTSDLSPASVASAPEALVDRPEMRAYDYGSIPRAAKDIENGTNSSYTRVTSSDRFVHDLTRRRIFSSCMCTYLFFIAMDSAILMSIVSTIASEFHELWRLSLIVSVYLLSNAIGQLVFLKLSIVSSVKLLLCVAQISFILGSYLSWSAFHFWTFIFARSITGFGSGALMVLKSTIINRFSDKKKDRYSLSASVIVFSLGVAIGPFLGYLFDTSHGSGWKNAFLIPVPFCLVNASIMLADIYSIKDNLHHGGSSPLSWKKLKKILLSPDLYEILALVVLLLWFVQATSLDITRLEHSAVIQGVMFFVFIACGILFWWIESNETYVNSIISMSLRGDKHLMWIMMGISSCFAALMCIIPFGTTYFTIVLNMSTLQIAERLLPVFFSIVVGYISVCYFWKPQTQNYMLEVVLSGVTLILYIALMGASLSLPVWKQYACLSLPLLGSCMILTSLSNLYHEYHQPKKSPISGSLVYCFSAMGGTIGVSLGGYVFHKTLLKTVHDEVMKFRKHGHLEKDLLKIIKHATQSSDWVHESAPRFIFETLIECYLQACRNVFKLSAMLFTITVITIFFFNRIN